MEASALVAPRGEPRDPRPDDHPALRTGPMGTGHLVRPTCMVGATAPACRCCLSPTARGVLDHEAILDQVERGAPDDYRMTGRWTCRHHQIHPRVPAAERRPR